MEEFGPWDGERATAPDAPKLKERKLAKSKLWLSSWKQMLDHGSMQDGAESLRETARPAVARVSESTYASLGAETVTVTGDRGSITLPVEAADLPDDTVWVPANSNGNVLASLASPGSAVTVKGAR